MTAETFVRSELVCVMLAHRARHGEAAQPFGPRETVEARLAAPAERQRLREVAAETPRSRERAVPARASERANIPRPRAIERERERRVKGV